MTHFTSDWFSNNIPIWTNLLKSFKDKPNLKFLEIGVFEGRATLWLLENILTYKNSKIYAIDTFRGGMEHQVDIRQKELKLDTLYKRFKENVKKFKKHIKIYKGQSQIILRQFKTLPQFDFVYIDGSHKAPDVLEDSVLSFKLLKSNGIMLWDDYLWDGYKNPCLNPKLGIDSFLKTFKGQYDILHKAYQVAIKKNNIKN